MKICKYLLKFLLLMMDLEDLLEPQLPGAPGPVFRPEDRPAHTPTY